MPEFAEVLFPRAEQGGAVDLGVAADEIVQPRMELGAIGAIPGLGGLVDAIDEDGIGVPVGAGPWEVVATLQHQDPLAAGGEPVRQGRSPWAAADDDDVEMVVGGGHLAGAAFRGLSG